MKVINILLRVVVTYFLNTSPKEAQLRQWYCIADGLVASSKEPTGGDDESNECLLQTESEGEVLAETPSGSEACQTEFDDGPDGELLLATDSENEVAQPPAKKRRYRARSSEQLTFLGKPVCKHAHARLYSVSARAIQNVRDGGQAYTGTGEARLPEPKHEALNVSLRRDAQHVKWPNVLAFFWMLYISAAEILPTKLTMPRAGKFESVGTADPDYEERYVQSFMQSLEKNFDPNPATSLRISRLQVSLGLYSPICGFYHN